jgi:hypothetical protein
MHVLTYQVVAESLFEIDFVKDKGYNQNLTQQSKAYFNNSQTLFVFIIF